MRNGQKRMRGRGGHRKSQNPLTRVYESNGPDVKIRGTASHIAEKYIQLARDAQSSGDPVAAENYYQHAEHYFRLIAAAQEQFRQQNPYYQQQQQQGASQGGDDSYDEERRRGSALHGPERAELRATRGAAAALPAARTRSRFRSAISRRVHSRRAAAKSRMRAVCRPSSPATGAASGRQRSRPKRAWSGRPGRPGALWRRLPPAPAPSRRLPRGAAGFCRRRAGRPARRRRRRSSGRVTLRFRAPDAAQHEVMRR